MPTVIDSLQIEIQSGSSNAASGIDALAGSLDRLKKYSKLTTVTKNLTALSAAVKGFHNASGAASSLVTLASAVERLRGVKSIASITNNLTKLTPALKGIENINLGRAEEQLRGIASAVGPLTEIKTSGFASMVNGLAKIDKVTKELDDDKINAFAERVKKLNDLLGPLSDKMATIGPAFKAINTGAGKAARAVEEFDHGVHTATLNLSSMIHVVQSVAAAIANAVRAFTEITAGAIEWDGIAARFGRGFGERAQETYNWIQRLNEEMGINVQQFMQYSSLYAQMLSGFGVTSEDSSKMALGYTELTYDIWASANDRYKTFADAAEAVASAIAGEVEPIRRAGFTIIESTLEQTAANHGLNISIEKATEAQKSYLRYLTLVDQAHTTGVIGSYARELNTAEGMTRALAQQIKSLSQAFGSLFLPILVKIIPYVQAFVELLTEAIHSVAAFFGIELQDIRGTWGDFTAGTSEAVDGTNAVAGALGDAADAAKELKNATIGIDELNVISPKAASGSGSGGAGGNGAGGGFDGLDVESLWDESIFDGIQSQVDTLKNKILGFFDKWKIEIGIIGAALSALTITSLLSSLGEALNLGDKFLGVINSIAKFAVTSIIITIQYTLMSEFFDSYINSGEFTDYIKALFVGAIATGVLYSMWGPAGIVIGLGVTAAASLSAIIENGGIDSVESALTALTGLAAAIGAVATAWKVFAPVGKEIVVFFKDYASAVKLGAAENGLLAAMFPKLTGFISSFVTAISGAASSVVSFLAGISAPVWAAIAAAIAAVVSVVMFLKENWDEVTSAAKKFFEENIAPKLENIKEHLDKVKEALAPVSDLFSGMIEWIKKAALAVAEWVKEVGLLEGIATVFEWLGGIIFSVVSGVIAGAFNTFVGLIENAVQIFSGSVQAISGVIELIVALFTGGDIEAAWGKIWDGVVECVKGVWGLITDPIVDLVEGVIGWFTNLWDELVGHSIVPDIIDGIVDCFVSLPGKVLGKVSDFVGSVIDTFKTLGSGISGKFSSAWSTVTSWWNKKSDLDTYTPTIGGIKDKVSSAWTTAKNWYDDKKAKFKEYTPSIGSIYEKAKERWDNARTWWDSKKTKMKEYTPSIGSIYEKAKERWDNARTWWNDKKTAMKTYTPSIGSIADKVKSAWNSAKDWWNRNVKGLSTKLDIKVPKITIEWTSTTVLGKKFKYPSGFDITFAADGGIFDAGSLIWAGERGAEVVANAGGGKTGVMNVEQMQEAVYEGVYAAMTAAMSKHSGGGTQGVNVYLDSRQITSTVEQRQREKGASIMGNEVFA